MILTIRTDKPEAEIGLFDNSTNLAYNKWEAHRQLSETIHKKIETLLKSRGKDWQDLDGLVCFKGPGSFTGLRIGLSVGSALAYSLGIPIVTEKGENWQQAGIERLAKGKSEKIALPDYGGEAYTTLPRK